MCNYRHAPAGGGCCMEGETLGVLGETGPFADCYSVYYLFKRCWALDPWLLSLLQPIHSGVIWPSMGPCGTRGSGNQHRYVGMVGAAFSLSNKVLHLSSRGFRSSVSIHETNLLAWKW